MNWNYQYAIRAYNPVVIQNASNSRVHVVARSDMKGSEDKSAVAVRERVKSSKKHVGERERGGGRIKGERSHLV